MTTVSLELALRMVEPAADALDIGMSWRSHRDEDRLLVDPTAALYAVFDGAGGHGDGAAAASIAADAVNHRVRAGLPRCRDLADVATLLDLALADADAAIATLDAGRPEALTSPSATTATVVLICRQTPAASPLVAVIANLGDSRVQLLRDGRLDTITLDHSYLGDPDPQEAMARQDRLDAARELTDLPDPMDRAAFTQRHLLANALTGTGVRDVRHYLVELEPGDRLLLDSDGIHDNLTSTELAAAVSTPGPAPEAAERVMTEAWARSEEEAGDYGRAKPDDMTVLVLDIHRPDENTSEVSGAYRLPPGGSASLSLTADRRQYLVSAADLQLLIAQRDGRWWATQPGAAPGELGSWLLTPGETTEFGREVPGAFRTAPSEQVSRRHVALTLGSTSEKLAVKDLNSTNGTTVLGW